MTSWTSPEQGEPIDPNSPTRQAGDQPAGGYPPSYPAPPGYQPYGYPAAPASPAGAQYGVPPGYGTPPAYGASPAYGAPPAYPAYPAATGYPAVPGYPPYPAAGFSPYGYPTPGDFRPGTATTAAVLGFVVAGLLILAGLLLFLGASIAGDIEDALNSGSHVGVELALDGVVNLVAGGLLIAGGVSLLGRKANSRVLLAIGGGIVVAAAIYWLTRFDEVSGAGWTFYAVLFLVLTTLTLAFAWTTPVTRWLRGPA